MTAVLTDVHEHQLWDCVVIGAGPAGAIAARRTAQQGLRTLIVDKKTFPRFKVCGACLNQYALQILAQAGLSELPDQCGARSISRLQLRSRKKRASIALPPGVALSRAALDHALVQAAVAAGAVFLPATTAVVEPLPSGRSSEDSLNRDAGIVIESRTVQLRGHNDGHGFGQGRRKVAAQIVIAADGLGHACLQELDEFTETIAPRSRIGVGAVVEADGGAFEDSAICMSVGRTGYVGVVRIEDNRLNIAGCVDADEIRRAGGPGQTVTRILEDAGTHVPAAAGAQWVGTPPLTRRISDVAGHRILVVGDAAAYIEPFTGEGIAWALAGGVTAADCAVEAVQSCPQTALARWRRQWKARIRKRQAWCQRLASLLRSPVAVDAAVRLAAAFPSVPRQIAARLTPPAT